MGFANSFTMVPLFDRLITYTKQAGYPDSVHTMSVIGSSLFMVWGTG